MDAKLRNLKQKRVLWLDLEMTGLSPKDDLILEVAAIVTDWNFNEIASFTGVVKNSNLTLKKRLAKNSAFWDANPESRDGLILQNKDGKSLKDVEADLIKFIDCYFDKKAPIILAGNSVHVDRRFIVEKWPKFDGRLHYRILDVGAWKVVFENKFDKKFLKPDAHRALDDIRGSIEELRHYLTKLK